MPSDQSDARFGPSGTPVTDDALAPRPIRLCIIATVVTTIQVLYRGRFEYFKKHGFDVTVVCASSDQDDQIRARGVRLHTAPLTRLVTPGRDLRTLWNLWRFLRHEQFDLVEVGTPKAALIGSVAARLAGTPCLIHLLHGLAYEGQRALMGKMIRWATAMVCRLAHVTISVSPSLREQAHQDGVCDRARVRVLGSGSCNGVDLQRFSPERRPLGAEVRGRYGIPETAVVIGFVGRMTRAKGLAELVAAFRELCQTTPDAALLLLGGYEDRDRPPPELLDFLARDPHVRHVGWQTDPVPFLAAMDVFVLPSHREGLGVALLEAAAMGLPTVATDATGCRNALVDGVTGLQVPVGDAARLSAAIARLAGDAALRRQMGAAGRRWVEAHFDQARVWALYAEEYRRLAGR